MCKTKVIAGMPIMIALLALPAGVQAEGLMMGLSRNDTSREGLGEFLGGLK